MRYLFLILLLSGCCHTHDFTKYYTDERECLIGCADDVTQNEEGDIIGITFRSACGENCKGYALHRAIFGDNK